MSASSNVTHSDTGNHTTPSKMLLVAWVCSLLWDIGVLIVTGTYVLWALGGLATFSDPEPMSGKEVFLMSLGVIMSLAGPVFLGFFLTNKWKRAFWNGLLAVLVGLVGSLTGWVLGGAFSSWLGSINIFGPQRLALQHIDDGLNLLLPPIFSAAGMITIVLLKNVLPFPRRILGVGIGLFSGLMLTIISWLLLEQTVPTPIIWVSAVYFVEWVAGRAGWKDFTIWLLLVLAALALPFTLYPFLSHLPLFCTNC